MSIPEKRWTWLPWILINLSQKSSSFSRSRRHCLLYTKYKQTTFNFKKLRPATFLTWFLKRRKKCYGYFLLLLLYCMEWYVCIYFHSHNIFCNPISIRHLSFSPKCCVSVNKTNLYSWLYVSYFFIHTHNTWEKKKDDGGNDDDGNDYNFFLPSEKLPHEVNVTGNEAKRK